MHDKITSRRRPLMPASQRTAWTRQDLLTLFPFSYNFWAKVPHGVLPCVRDGKNYVYDACDVIDFLGRLKWTSLEALVTAAGTSVPKGRKRGRPSKKP
ncbi:MAG TPA: hypothetical protein VK196_15750 [Magnetospirillum sp.]|nr:hypothetical protein [Magnetospirillum sp.]